MKATEVSKATVCNVLLIVSLELQVTVAYNATIGVCPPCCSFRNFDQRLCQEDFCAKVAACEDKCWPIRKGACLIALGTLGFFCYW